MSGQEWAAVIMAAATLVSSLAGLAVALRTGAKTSATHDLVNGASAQINELREARGRAEGLSSALNIQGHLLEGKPGSPLADGSPAFGANVLSAVPPGSPQMDPVPPAGDAPPTRGADNLRERRPE